MSGCLGRDRDRHRETGGYRDSWKIWSNGGFSFPLEPLHGRAFEFAGGFALFQILAFVELLFPLPMASATFTLPFFQ